MNRDTVVALQDKVNRLLELCYDAPLMRHNRHLGEPCPACHWLSKVQAVNGESDPELMPEAVHAL